MENTTLQQQHPSSVGPGASVLLLGSALAMGALQNQASIFGVSPGRPDGTAVLLPPRDPQGCHPHWGCWLRAVIFTEGFQTDPLKAGRLLSSPYLIAVFTHPFPPLQSSLNFQLLIRQSTVARSSVIKELKPYLKNADVIAKLNYLRQSRPLIMHVLQSSISR